MGLAPETNYLRDVQYRTPVNLNARMVVHIVFSTNEYGWPRWLSIDSIYLKIPTFSRLGAAPEPFGRGSQRRRDLCWSV